MKLSNEMVLRRDCCFAVVVILCETLGVGFFCALYGCLAKGVGSKHCYKAQEKNLVLLLQGDCKKIPS